MTQPARLNFPLVILVMACAALPHAALAQAQQPRFSTKINLALIGSYSAALAIDAHTTYEIVGSKIYYEQNPILAPFVKSHARVVAAFAANESITLGAAYALHRFHHPRLAKIFLLSAASYETSVDIYNTRY